MKVSEAIAQLIEFEDTFGDVEVVFSDQLKPVPLESANKNAHIEPATIDWINGIHSRN